VKNTSGDVVVLDVPSLEVVSRLPGKGEGTPVRFAADGDHLVDATWGGTLAVRELDGTTTWAEDGHNIFRLACTRDRGTWIYDPGADTRAQMAVRRARGRTSLVARCATGGCDF
jgi:hypothetical protein